MHQSNRLTTSRDATARSETPVAKDVNSYFERIAELSAEFCRIYRYTLDTSIRKVWAINDRNLVDVKTCNNPMALHTVVRPTWNVFAIVGVLLADRTFRLSDDGTNAEPNSAVRQEDRTLPVICAFPERQSTTLREVLSLKFAGGIQTYVRNLEVVRVFKPIHG